MFKKFGLFLVTIISFLIGINFVGADSEKNLVNIYLFYSNACPHCAAEKALFDEILDDYDNVKLYKYEVSDKDNGLLLDEVAALFDTSVTGVPLTVIGDKIFKGYSDTDSKMRFMATIEYYSFNGYNDRVGEYLGNVDLPKYEIKENQENINEYIDEYSNYRIDVPILGVVETKNLTLPVIAILIGLVDGFNPCAMWVLLFLISMLIGLKDKKKMLILGLAFLVSSALIYLLFMLAWLNAASLILSINYVRTGIGAVAIVGAIINLVSYVKHRKDNGCNVVDDKKRSKIFKRIKKFTSEKNLWLALVGVILLACSVNIVELACSAGLPVMFINILSMNNLNSFEEMIYITLYMLFFLIDDLIVFFIAVRTMQVTGFSTKYGKISKLVGGLLLLGIGLLLIFKPEWLMFNF